MSRVGRKPIAIPSGVEIKINGTKVHVKGSKGEIEREFNPNMKIESADGNLTVSRPDDSRTNRAMHGLTRALLNNMVTGVSTGFSKQLNIVGVGYKVDLKGKDLVLQLGFSHPVSYPAPKGIEFEVDSKANTIKVKGSDKQQVGQVSAEIRKFRPPEPYKGKGVMYADERIRRKAGKAAGSGSK
jgi:large subunit ribosomal protein L6